MSNVRQQVSCIFFRATNFTFFMLSKGLNVWFRMVCLSSFPPQITSFPVVVSGLPESHTNPYTSFLSRQWHSLRGQPSLAARRKTASGIFPTPVCNPLTSGFFLGSRWHDPLTMGMSQKSFSCTHCVYNPAGDGLKAMGEEQYDRALQTGLTTQGLSPPQTTSLTQN